MHRHLRRIYRRFINSPWAVGSATFMVLMICLLPFRGETTCSDGAHSSSIGRRGACSHHGGVGMRGGTIPLVLSLAGGLFVGIRRAARRHERTFEALDNLDQVIDAVDSALKHGSSQQSANGGSLANDKITTANSRRSAEYVRDQLKRADKRRREQQRS
ncbi:hypothetical protein [Mesorhizobium sp. B2-6-5]|uniref:hypothetical protein n=1 Tax=Mesorhizobium sp. B2-6-5 TaxID=2589912 RepID=UPI0011266D07|nr:hypothetical protein [Mesorhizobium sp. B2-6-5]TPJ38550.1 hypothetical protein FJ432_22070 [Mesorhizobium sp. B2-6-5]